MAKATTPQAPIEGKFKVILTTAAAGGRRAVGDMLPDREYEHGAREALRLIETKGFAPVGASTADVKAEAERFAKALADYEAAVAAATTTPEG